MTQGHHPRGRSRQARARVCLPNGNLAPLAKPAKSPKLAGVAAPINAPAAPKTVTGKKAGKTAGKPRLLNEHVTELAVLSVSESGRLAMAQVLQFVARYLLPLSRAKELQCLSAFRVQPGSELTQRSNLFKISMACGYPLDRSYGELQRCSRELAINSLDECAKTAAAMQLLRDGLAILMAMYDLLYITTVTNVATNGGFKFGDVHKLLLEMVGAERTPVKYTIAWYDELYIATYVAAVKAKPATATAPARLAAKARPGDTTRWLPTPYSRCDKKVNTYRKRYSNYDSHERVLKSTRAVVGTLETTSTPTALQATLEEGADCYGPFKSMVVARSASTVPTADVAIGAPTDDNISPPNDRGCAKRMLRLQGGDYAVPSREQVQLFSVVADREMQQCGPALLGTLLCEEPKALREAKDIREVFAVAKSLVRCGSGVVIGEAAAGCDVERAESKGTIVDFDQFPSEAAWSLAHLGHALPMSIWAPPGDGAGDGVAPSRRTRPILLDIVSAPARSAALDSEVLTPSAQTPVPLYGDPLCTAVAHTSRLERMSKALQIAKTGLRGRHRLEPATD